MTLTGLTMTSYVGNGWYGQAVVETQGDTTLTRLSDDIWSQSAYNFGFFSSSKVACASSSVTAGLSETLPFARIIPNPTVGDFTIDSQGNWQRAELYNALGQSVGKFTYGEKTTLAGQASGLYWLVIYFPENHSSTVLSILNQEN